MKTYTEIDRALREFVESQHMFFVGTATCDPHGHVNISPKGMDSLRVLGPKTVAYADYTGSGVETIAHLRENGRIAIMVCAFSGAPRIVRLHGEGEAIEPQDDRFASLLHYFRDSSCPEAVPLRSIIRIVVERISESCGYGVPLYQFEAQRTQLARWASSKGPSGVREYQMRNNARSIDGLKGLRS